MNEKESSELMLTLLRKYPVSTVDADEYERAMLKFDANLAREAVESLQYTSKFMPSISEIQEEITRTKRERARIGMAPIIMVPGRSHGGPSAAEWGECLKRLLERSAKYRRMVEPMFTADGKPYPGDPGQVFIDLAVRGAAGEDVLGEMKAAVLPKRTEEPKQDFDPDEWDRRFP